MCKACWTEHGSPDEWTPTTGRVVALIGELYELHPAGGPLHVALDDWNLADPKHLRPWDSPPPPGPFDDDHRTEYDDRTRQLSNEISELLTAMTVPQRYAALAYFWGFMRPPDHGEG